MPTYEYACKACDHTFEIVQSFSEDALTTCPACEQEQLRKVYNAAGIIFKGDGWHSKDYASSPKSTSSSPSPGEGNTSSTSSDSSDASGSSSGSTSSGTSGSNGSSSSGGGTERAAS